MTAPTDGYRLAAIPAVVRVTVQGETARTYEVPTAGLVRVLDLLNYIYEEIDPNIAYRRHLCRNNVCMACLMLVNGKATLACTVPLEAGRTEYELAPLAGRPVIRGLVIDYLTQRRPDA